MSIIKTPVKPPVKPPVKIYYIDVFKIQDKIHVKQDYTFSLYLKKNEQYLTQIDKKINDNFYIHNDYIIKILKNLLKKIDISLKIKNKNNIKIEYSASCAHTNEFYHWKCATYKIIIEQN